MQHHHEKISERNLALLFIFPTETSEYFLSNVNIFIVCVTRKAIRFDWQLTTNDNVACFLFISLRLIYMVIKRIKSK